MVVGLFKQFLMSKEINICCSHPRISIYLSIFCLVMFFTSSGLQGPNIHRCMLQYFYKPEFYLMLHPISRCSGQTIHCFRSTRYFSRLKSKAVFINLLGIILEVDPGRPAASPKSLSFQVTLPSYRYGNVVTSAFLLDVFYVLCRHYSL